MARGRDITCSGPPSQRKEAEAACAGETNKDECVIRHLSSGLAGVKSERYMMNRIRPASSPPAAPWPRASLPAAWRRRPRIAGKREHATDARCLDSPAHPRREGGAHQLRKLECAASIGSPKSARQY